MEEIDNEEDFPCNMAPTNKSCIIELSDGSDDDEEDQALPPLVTVDDNDDDDKDKDKVKAPEESEEAELGQLLP
jgi:hypothetical protein